MSYITILGIDPGIHNCGISFNKYDPKTGIMSVADYFTIHAASSAKKEDKRTSEEYGTVFSLICLEKIMREILDKYKPDYVASEDAFYSPRTPNAFVSLKLCINSIQRVLFEDYRKQLFKIPPKLAKAAVSQGTANKVAVQTSIRNLPDLKLKDTKSKPLDDMIEHEADAIAIAYAFRKLILPDILMTKK